MATLKGNSAQDFREPVPEDVPKTFPEAPDGRDDAQFLETATKRFVRIMTEEAKNRQEAVEDLKFKQGDQWPQGIKATRNAEDRPCLTVNKMKTFVHQITNSQREDRPSIKVSPIGDKGDKQVAKMLMGMIRHIERQSDADVAYDTGFDSAVSNGWGYWRVLTDYESDDTFDQCLRIVRIRNPFTVYLDPDRKQPDGSDAKYGFVSEIIPVDEFRAQYPDADDGQAWLESGLGDSLKEWVTKTHIRVAEYFVIETEFKRLVALDNGHVGYWDDLDKQLQEEVRSGLKKIVTEREAECQKVRWYTITGKQILDERDWPGCYIPIVECVGDEIDVEGKVNKAGIIRDAKDAQRMYNYWVTNETELVALQPKAPYIIEEGQIEGYENQWRAANRKSYPVLIYKGSSIGGTPAPPPQRAAPPQIPAGVVQAKQGAAMDMQATTGLRFDGTQQERMSDESGIAIDRLQRMGDLGAYHYIDNLARSLKHTGRILIDLIPKVYDTRRTITILREGGEEESVQLDPLQSKAYEEVTDADGEKTKSYNPSIGKFEVAVTIGPSYATKRTQASGQMIEFAKAFPGAAPAIQDLVAANQDWPGADQLAQRLAKMLPPNLQDIQDSDLPAAAIAMIQGLKSQLQQVTQQRDQAMLQVNSQDKDRALQQDKINKDFEAKLLTIQERAEANQNTHLVAQMKEMMALLQTLKPPEKSGLDRDEQRRAALNPMD